MKCAWSRCVNEVYPQLIQLGKPKRCCCPNCTTNYYRERWTPEQKAHERARLHIKNTRLK